MKVASLLLLLTLVCPLVMAAQSPGVTTEQLKERTKTFRNNKRFSVEYDRFKNLTHISVGPFRVEDGLVSGLSVEAWFTFKGTTRPAETTTVYLTVSRYGSGWAFLDDRRLLAIIDGQRLDFGEGDRESSVRRGGVSEALYYDMPFERFEQVANAKSVEMRIASKEFTLKDEHREAFRDLISLATR